MVNAANHAKDVAWMQQQRSTPTRARRGSRGHFRLARNDRNPGTDGRGRSWPRLTDDRLVRTRAVSHRARDCRRCAGARRAHWIHRRRRVRVLRAAGTDRRALGRAACRRCGDGASKPIGLGARDTLRLEARMPLYGNELADDISPIEAGLGWAVKLDKGPFIGREAIAAIKESGPSRRTVGFQLLERAGSARHGYPVTAGRSRRSAW